MGRIFVQLMLAMFKVFLGSLLAVLVLAILLSLGTGEPVAEVLFVSGTKSNEIVIDVMKNLISQIPFTGYFLDGWDAYKGFADEGGYKVFHDCIKALMLVLSAGLFYGLQAKLKCRWKRMNKAGIAACIDWIADAYLVGIYAIVIVLFTVIAHAKLLEFWTRIFGNGFLSNCGLLSAVILALIGICYSGRTGSRSAFIDVITSMLLNFGLAVCVVVFIMFLNLPDQLPASAIHQDGWFYVRWILSVVLSIVAIHVLLVIKIKNMNK